MKIKFLTLIFTEELGETSLQQTKISSDILLNILVSRLQKLQNNVPLSSSPKWSLLQVVHAGQANAVSSSTPITVPIILKINNLKNLIFHLLHTKQTGYKIFASAIHGKNGRINI